MRDICEEASYPDTTTVGSEVVLPLEGGLAPVLRQPAARRAAILFNASLQGGRRKDWASRTDSLSWQRMDPRRASLPFGKRHVEQDVHFEPENVRPEPENVRPEPDSALRLTCCGTVVEGSVAWVVREGKDSLYRIASQPGGLGLSVEVLGDFPGGVDCLGPFVKALSLWPDAGAISAVLVLGRDPLREDWESALEAGRRFNEELLYSYYTRNKP